MIITKTQLRKIIKEEIENVQREGLKGGSIAGGHPLRWLRYVLTSDEPMNAMNAWFDKQEQINKDSNAELDKVRTEEEYQAAADKYYELKNAEKDPIHAFFDAHRGGSLPTRVVKALDVWNERDPDAQAARIRIHKKIQDLGDKFRSTRYARQARAREEAEQKKHREILAQVEKDKKMSQSQAKSSRKKSGFDAWQEDDAAYDYMTRMEESKESK